MRIRLLVVVLISAVLACGGGCGSKQGVGNGTDVASAAGFRVSCIWNEGYSAFPSITVFNGKYYVAFREAKSHVFDENGSAAGKARILVSDDGEKWTSAGLIEKEGYDLRDPKLSVTPDNRLMVTMGGSVYENRVLVKFVPQVSFSSDGQSFTPARAVVFDENITDEREWIWRVTWKGDIGYGVTYGEHFALVSTRDGVHYDFVKELDLDRVNAPGEATIRFTPDGRMLMMVRCDSGDCKGRWGVSDYPYTEWTWQTMEMHLGGPDFILLENGTVVAGTRYSFPSGRNKTMILRGTEKGEFEEMYLVPSGGDTSYPGFLQVGDTVWMVYYSCHGSRAGIVDGTMYDFDSLQADRHQAAIYMARFPISAVSF